MLVTNFTNIYNSVKKKKKIIELFIFFIGTQFVTQAQDVWDPGPMSPVQ